MSSSAHKLLKRIFSSKSNQKKQATTNTMSSANNLEKETQNLRLNDPDLMQEATLSSTSATKAHVAVKASRPYRFVPLGMGGSGGTHVVTPGSVALMEEVSLADLQNMTERFYQKAFKDPTLDQFIGSHDDPHGSRFSKWIHQKLSGSNVWDMDRAQRDRTPVTVAGGRTTVVHDRSSAHVAAWHSKKRPARDVGRAFKLDECRVWMRLHFWAMRESGIMEKSPSFADYYVRYLGHFVRVYESSAPLYARDSLRWSANPKNTENYKRTGRMDEVLGLSMEEAEASIPEKEANDFEWPYNQTPQ